MTQNKKRKKEMNNLDTTHPLIPNENTYSLEKKYISITSDDRNVIKFPDSSRFDIELPQEYQNVLSARMYSWTFPSNYSVFSPFSNNTYFTFRLTESSTLIETEYSFYIEEGFYSPTQMATELTNKMNTSVSDVYDQFVVVYNEVSMNLWFGNKSDFFTLVNDTTDPNNFQCLQQGVLPEETNWGLPYFLGMSRINIDATPGNPRFYYGDVKTTGDNGVWLQGNTGYYAAAPMKINLLGPSYIYVDVPELNCIDETSPFSAAKEDNITRKSSMNRYNAEQYNFATGIVNSAFAKIPLSTTPLTQLFDNDMVPSKYFSPPLERIRKLSFRFRYHNFQSANFGNFPFSFMIELTLLRPQQNRSLLVHDGFNSGLLRRK